MKTTVKVIEPNKKVELTVEIDADEVAREIEKEYKELSETVKIPGFRQGKVPRPVLERHLGPDAVVKKVVQRLVPETYPRAIDEAEVRPIDSPQVNVEEMKEGQPFVYRAVIDVEPAAQISDYKGIPVTVPPRTASEDEIQADVDRLREKFAKLAVVEDRTVLSGDFALIDFTGHLDDIPFEGGEGTDFLLEIGSGRFLPGFEDALIGAAKGEQKEVWIDVPGDYHGEHIAGKRVRFDVKVTEIKTKELPTADDDFAAEASEHDTIEDLRASVRVQIEEARERGGKLRGQSQILDWLQENVQVDVPSQLADLKHEELLQQFLEMIQSQGLTVEEYFKLSESNQEALRASMEAEALKRVREELGLDAVAQAEQLTLSDMEFQEEIDAMAQRAKQDAPAVRARLEERGNIAEFKRSLLRRKALDWLSDHATVSVQTEEEQQAETERKEALRAQAAEVKKGAREKPAATTKAKTSKKPAAKTSAPDEGEPVRPAVAMEMEQASSETPADESDAADEAGKEASDE